MYLQPPACTCTLQAVPRENYVSLLPNHRSLTVVNMAAAVCRVLSFTRNAKALLQPVRLTAVPVHRYSVEVSSTGEAITHTGQVGPKRPLLLVLNHRPTIS